MASPTAVGLPPWTARKQGGMAVGTPATISDGWLASQGRLPLAFMGLGLAWLIGATAMLVAQPGLLALPHVHPRVVALTHAWVLGLFLTVACGAAYQLAPVALGTTLWSERCGWWHFGLHAAGVPGMVYSFWYWDLPLLGHSGFLVALGIALFAQNIWRTMHRSGRRDAIAWALALAAGWLLLTALAGLTLAANRFWYFIPADPLALLRAHAHLGLIGFFVTLLQGVVFNLIPMFTLGKVREWWPIRTGLWLSQGGLLGLVPSIALHAGPEAVAFSLAIVLGFVCSGWELVRTLGTRKKRVLDPGVRVFLRGLIGLGAAAVAGVLLEWPGSPWGSPPGGFSATIYALLGLAGGLLPIVTGMMCKIVPFLTWMRAYGPRVGRGATPSAASLTHPRIEWWALALQGMALLPLLAGAWMLNETILRVGAWLLAAGVALFVIDMLCVISHMWRASSMALGVLKIKTL